MERTSIPGGPGGSTFNVQIINVGKAVHVWCGEAGAPLLLDNLASAVPAPQDRGWEGSGERSAASCLLGDSSAYEELAGRLSASCRRLVLLSLSMKAEGGDAPSQPGEAAAADDAADAALKLAWLEKRLVALLGALGPGRTGGSPAAALQALAEGRGVTK